MVELLNDLLSAFGQNLQFHGLVHGRLLGFVVGLSAFLLLHFALTKMSQRFLFLLYDIRGFSVKASLFWHSCSRCQCRSIICFRFGFAGLYVTSSGILLEFLFVVDLGLSARSVSLFRALAFPLDSCNKSRG